MNIIFIIVMLGFFSFLIWYTAYRLSVHFKFISFWTLQVITATGVIGFFLTSAVISMKFSNLFLATFNIIAGYLFLFLFYLFFLLVILHIIRRIWKPSLIWSGVAALAVAFIVVFIGAIIALSFTVTETEIKIKGLERELTIMHISDVHIGHHRGRNFLTKIVEATNKRNPDLVVITGDLVDAEPTLRPGALEPLSKIKAPVYFVEGNHEKYLGAERLLSLIGYQNVYILRNEIIETHGIQLIGLNYMRANNERFDMSMADDSVTVKSVLTELPIRSDIPSILISHSPGGFRYVVAAGVDLMLAGHTHGGQFYPMPFFRSLNFPMRGLYQYNNTQVFISSGAGTSFMIRVRLGSVNEINFLRLVPDN